MKYLIVLGDGMADRPVPELNHQTPLRLAVKPTIDRLARMGQVGLVRTVPDGMKPGSDVANLSVMGYDPARYYSGRSPLEALSIGVPMTATDVAMRANLVTLSDPDLSKAVMTDYSAGEISTEEARVLIEDLAKELDSDRFRLYPGVSYRHCLLVKNGSTAVSLTPPHDISGQPVRDHLPQGDDARALLGLIERSGNILCNHPVNRKRIAEGKNPATNLWFWGAGTRPALDDFRLKYGLCGAVVSAVDLLKGIAVGAGMRHPDVVGATGTLHTNLGGKLDAVKQAFETGADFVYLHLEAPDECGHQGDASGKIKAIEMVDRATADLVAYLDNRNEPYVVAVLPDHATPLSIRTHSAEPVPYLIYDSRNPANSGLVFNETDAQKGVFLPQGDLILKTMLQL